MSEKNGRRTFLRNTAALAGLGLSGQALSSPSNTAPPAPDRPPRFSPEDIVAVADAEAAAETLLPAPYLAYLQGGAGDEHSLRWNQERFQEIKLNPRVLRDLGALDTRCALFGDTLPAPILFAPTATNLLFHEQGELAVAAGASATGTTYVLSTTANTSVEAVAARLTSPLWFQLYVQHDLAAAKDLIRRAEAAGAKTICITVDSPVPGTRSRADRFKYRYPRDLPLPHFVPTPSKPKPSPYEVIPQKLVWSDVEALIAHARVPVLLKGILNAADAEIALQAGAAGLIVSNHGARNLDTTPATIEALPAIAQAIAGRVPVLMDGGVRRGTDIVKALALGARAVLIGRPYLYGLVCGGAEGVAHVQRILLKELRMAMGLLGCRDLNAITSEIIYRSA